VDNYDDCPTKIENERLKFDLGCSKTILRTVESHKLKDIQDLETRIEELEYQLRTNHNGNAV